MTRYIVSFQIVNSETRFKFINSLEKCISNLGLNKSPENNNSFLGNYSTALDLTNDLISNVNKLSWHYDDEMILYFPVILDIQNQQVQSLAKHVIKMKGFKLLNSCLN